MHISPPLLRFLPPFRFLLPLLLLFPPPTHTATLTLHLPPPNPSFPTPSLLPPSTHATLTSAHLPPLTAPLRRASTFLFPDLPPGSYLLDIECRDYNFASYRVDVGGVSEDGEGKEKVEVWQTFRGNEWENRGEKVGGGVVEVRVEGRKGFYEERGGFSPMSLLQNPMILLAVLGFGLMVGMPYLIDSMDPEMKKEFQEHQKKGGLGGALGAGAAGGNPLQNFDMAAWMAGTPAKSDGPDGEGAARTRRRN